jgi:adhesin transport system outer membrane protein
MTRRDLRVTPSLTTAIALGAFAASAFGASASAASIPPEPALAQLLRTALVASPVLNARRAELSAARTDIDAARWQYTPAFSADVQQGSNTPSLNERVLRLDQKLYAGGRLDADLRGATARRDSAVYAVQESALALALQIVGAYQSLAAANTQIGAIGAYKLRLDALDGTIARRIDSGVSAPADRALMYARITQSNNDLASARAAQRSAIATLEKLVGEPTVVHALAAGVAVPAAAASAAAPGATAAATATIDTPAAVCGDDAAADTQLRSALAQHPGLRRIERDIASARAGVDSQRAALKPAIGLRLEQPIAPGSDAVIHSTRVSLVLQYTPDAGLSSLARVQGADDRVGSLVNQADALQRDVVQQIRAECADQAGTIERVAGFALARGYTGEVLASSTRLFVAGKRGWLDLLNTAREDFDNEQAGIVAGAALIGSRHRLALLTGDEALALPGVADEPASSLSTSAKALLR